VVVVVEGEAVVEGAGLGWVPRLALAGCRGLAVPVTPAQPANSAPSVASTTTGPMPTTTGDRVAREGTVGVWHRRPR
jgi:hypothetical protein